MINILNNQIDLQQATEGSQAFFEFILAIQEDAVNSADLFQSSDIVYFPPVPEFGGVFKTPKGCYEAIYTDTVPSLPKWRRLSDSVLYEAGDTIPTTL